MITSLCLASSPRSFASCAPLRQQWIDGAAVAVGHEPQFVARFHQMCRPCRAPISPAPMKPILISHPFPAWLRMLASAASNRREVDAMTLHKNFINGEWVEGKARARTISTRPMSPTSSAPMRRPSDADAEAAIAAAKAAAPGWAGDHAAAARRYPRSRRRRAPGAQGRNRQAAGARGRQAARQWRRRDDARRADLQVLRAGGAAPGRRGHSLGAARRRSDGHARAAGRRRPHLPVEFPDRHSGLENGAGARLRQYGGVQAGRPRAGLGLGAGRDPVARRPSPRASSIW